MPKTQQSSKIVRCDECGSKISPGEPYYEMGGKIFCSICWGKP